MGFTSLKRSLLWTTLSSSVHVPQQYQWELFRRYDTVDFYGKGVEAKAADRAVQEDMAQDATFLKYYSKVKGSRDAAPEAAPVK